MMAMRPRASSRNIPDVPVCSSANVKGSRGLMGPLVENQNLRQDREMKARPGPGSGRSLHALRCSVPRRAALEQATR